MEAKPGEINWLEFATTDLETSKKFLLEITNWEIVNHNEEIGYTQLGLDGHAIAGIYQKGEKEPAENHGMTNVKVFFSTESAEETAKKVTENGGKVIIDPLDVMGLGICASFADPEGTPFHVWEPKSHRGMMKYVDSWKTGVVGWTEIYSRDIDAAAEFYESVLGVEKLPDPIFNYSKLAIPEHEVYVAGLMNLNEDQGDIPHWMVYINVDDVAAACEKVKELGGKVTLEPVTIPDNMSYAVIEDPTGIKFSICAMEGGYENQVSQYAKGNIKLLLHIKKLTQELEELKAISSAKRPREDTEPPTAEKKRRTE